jgi:hypothetical protein
MTGLQYIIPPIEENNIPQHGDVERRLRQASHEKEGCRNVSYNNQGVIPDELRQNFDAMMAIWRQADRQNGVDSADLDELRRKERAQAIETALAVEAEIVKWQTGIAELEAMLAADDDEDDVDRYNHDEERGSNNEVVDGSLQVHPVAAIRFPSLPPVVVPDDNDDNNSVED